MKLRVLVLVALATPALCPAADDASFTKLVQQIGSAVESDHAIETMRRVWATDRWFTFPKFRETAEYLKTAMTAAGLRDVDLLEAPADGVSRSEKRMAYLRKPLQNNFSSAGAELDGSSAAKMVSIGKFSS